MFARYYWLILFWQAVEKKEMFLFRSKETVETNTGKNDNTNQISENILRVCMQQFIQPDGVRLVTSYVT